MPERLGRRRFLQISAGAALAGVAYGTLGIPGVQPRPKPSAPPRVLTKEFHLGPGELSQGSRSGLRAGGGGLELGRGQSTGHYLSPILESDIPFNYVGVFWSGSNPDGSSVAFWVRTSPDGSTWGRWEPVHVEMPRGPRAEYDTYGSLIWADGASYVQFLGQLGGANDRPVLHRIGVILLNPYDGPPLETACDASDGGFAQGACAAGADSYLETGASPAAASGKPISFKREDWGADESLRFSGGDEIWPRSYVPTKKLIVHHTATSNGCATVEDAKAQVRAIYAYHARTLGWGDIGYNCLIDKFGNSYEGRRGRDGPGYDGPGGREILSKDVVAGHALAYNYGSSGIALTGTFEGVSPSNSALAKLRDVLAWECQQHGINPQASSDFLLYDGSWHRGLSNIIGHRDVGSTACPGGNAYALLPQLRRDVAARLADPAAPSVSITSAPPESTVTNGRAAFAWRGSGGSGGLEYSYYMEGWSRQSGTGLVNYTRGFTSRREPAWSPWARQTSAQLCFVAAGLYTFHVRARDSRGRVSVYHGSRTFRGTAQAKACDGALLQGSASPVYVVQGGLKRHIPNHTTFYARGFLWGNVNHIPASSLNAIATGQPLLDAAAGGNLLRATGPEVYVMESGRKRHITSRDSFTACGYGWDAVYTIPDSLLSAIPSGEALSGPPCPHLSPPPGSLIQDSGDAVYVMYGDLKRHVPNRTTFHAQGFLWGNVNRIPTSSLNAIATGQSLLDARADGNLLRGTGPEVYVMDSGRKRHITSGASFTACGYGWDAVYTIPDSLLNSIPSGEPISGPPCPRLSPPAGSLIRGSGDPVYVMQGGLKRHVPNRTTFHAQGFLWGNVNDIPASSLSAIATGQPLLDALADGNLLRGTGPEVYVMDSGRKRHITSQESFTSCGYGWDAVYTIPDSLLNSIPSGEPISGPPCPRLFPPDGSLIRGSGDPVYVMQGGLKRHILNWEAFSACGYLWGNVDRIADSALASIPTGDDLAGESCP